MPFCANYQKEYQKFDILPLLKRGKNTIGAVMGNGLYNCSSWGSLRAKKNEFAAIIEFTYEDGRTKYICTDENWRCTPSPLIENDIQYGERYDARLEKCGWCDNTADISAYTPVSVRIEEEDKMHLLQLYPFIKKVKERVCTDYRLIGDNIPMYDSGLCVAGRARVTFKNLPRGKKIRMRYCE